MACAQIRAIVFSVLGFENFSNFVLIHNLRGQPMCCFKRLAAKIKRHAGWGRKERPPAVSRPSQDVIECKKKSAKQGDERNARRRATSAEKEENRLRTEFFRAKGWLGPEEEI